MAGAGSGAEGFALKNNYMPKKPEDHEVGGWPFEVCDCPVCEREKRESKE